MNFFVIILLWQPILYLCTLFLVQGGKWTGYSLFPVSGLSQTAHSPSKHKDKHGFIISQCKHTEL